MYNIGIDLGGTGIKIGIVDKQGNIVKKISFPTGAQRENGKILQDIADGCKRICQESNILFDDIDSIGMGTPGLVQDGVIRFAGNLGFYDLDAQNILTQLIGKKVYVANDANVAALGEAKYGGGKGFQNAALFTLGTGLGLGIVLGGKIFVGSNGGAGEFGHTIVHKNGHKCTCGNKGCIETYTSATALVRDTKKAMRRDKNSVMWRECGGDIKNAGGRTAFSAAAKGDKAAEAVIDNYTDYVAIAVSNLVNVIQPEIVLIGGGVSGQGEGLLGPVREKAQKMFFGSDTGVELTKVEKALLGNDAGIIGAAVFGSSAGATTK